MAMALKNAARCAVYPLTAVGNKIHRRAVVAQRFQPEELQQTVAQYNATGDDLAAESTRKFIQLQLQLVPYRIDKMKQELNALCGEGCSMQGYTYKNWVIFARWVIRCMFLFMFGTMIGRRSVYPPVMPGSPFVKELQQQYTL